MYFIKNMKNLNEMISSYLHLVLEPTLSTVISSSKSSALLFGETAVLDSFNAAINHDILRLQSVLKYLHTLYVCSNPG